jgi:CRP-like cAMP-binding protein
MPRRGRARGISDTREVLTALPLFADIPEDELEVFARAARSAETPPGEDVWREGDHVDGLYVILSGRVSILGELPDEREVEVATLGPGGVLGEIPLLGGGPRWATVRAVEDSRFLVLGRTEFVALLARATPGALAVRRRLLALVCDRLRQRHQALAQGLGGGPAPVDKSAAAEQAMVAGTSAPEIDYALRLPFFRTFERVSAFEILDRGTVVDLPRGHPLLDEGAPASGCWITLNGAVEELIRRDGQAIRVRLAGPGYAFGYLGLIDGLPSSVAATTRERARLLFLPPEIFTAGFDPAALAATAFREAIERDLVSALRVSLRPQARLEAARSGDPGRREQPTSERRSTILEGDSVPG